MMSKIHHDVSFIMMTKLRQYIKNTSHQKYIMTLKSMSRLQWTLRRGDNLWSRDTFSERCPISPMLRNRWQRDTGHVGTLSFEYRRHVLLYLLFRSSSIHTFLHDTHKHIKTLKTVSFCDFILGFAVSI